MIEDSRIGMLAARAAGLRCLKTTSSYTARKDFAKQRGTINASEDS